MRSCYVYSVIEKKKLPCQIFIPFINSSWVTCQQLCFSLVPFPQLQDSASWKEVWAYISVFFLLTYDHDGNQEVGGEDLSEGS